MTEQPESPPCQCHTVCDCREALFSKAMETQRKVIGVLAYSDNHMRSDFGELTDGEIGLVRKVLNRICGNKIVDTIKTSE